MNWNVNLGMKNTNDPKAKYYRNYLIMGKFFFKIQEAAWWVVAELEDALYPYRDREVTEPLWVERGDLPVDEVGYLKHQMEATGQRVERLQEEMIHVLRRLGEINTLSDNKNDHSVERQKSSETDYQTSKEES